MSHRSRNGHHLPSPSRRIETRANHHLETCHRQSSCQGSLAWWPDIVDESLAAQMTRQRYRLKNGNPTPETYSCVKPASPFPEPWMPSRQCQLHTIVLSRVLSGDLPVVLPVAVPITASL